MCDGGIGGRVSGAQGGWWGVGRQSRIPPHVNYLLFALDNPAARCAARNENPESQGLHLRRGKKGGEKKNNAVVITTSSVHDQ